MTPQPCTRWRIVSVPNWRAHLNVELVVATTAKSVVDQIEFAAEEAGIALQRIEEGEE